MKFYSIAGFTIDSRSYQLFPEDFLLVSIMPITMNALSLWKSARARFDWWEIINLLEARISMHHTTFISLCNFISERSKIAACALEISRARIQAAPTQKLVYIHWGPTFVVCFAKVSISREIFSKYRKESDFHDF